MSVLDDTRKFGFDFLRLYQAGGYEVAPSVPVSSRIDPSVFLVGSTISVLKRDLLQGPEVPYRVLIQPAIRTQSLSRMERGEAIESIYGSYFLAMGTLAPYAGLADTAALACAYLRGVLPPGGQELLMRVSSADGDLLSICERLGAVEVDSRPLTYYRHRYGLSEQGIFGRNFNIAVPSAQGFSDVGNIIVIERGGVPFAVEFALGMSTLLTHLYHLPHTMLGNPVADILPMGCPAEYQLGDCISVVSRLSKEGVKPKSSNMRGRLLKRYDRVLRGLCQALAKDPDALLGEYSDYEEGLNPLLQYGG